MSDSAPFKSGPAASLRLYWVKMFATSLTLVGAMLGAIFVARAVGVRLPTFVALPVFLTLNSLLQPPFPGAPLRPVRQRLAFTLTVASLAGILLWLLERVAL